MSHFHPAAASSSSNFRLAINNALKAYEKRIGKDLLIHPLSSQLQACNGSAAILALLQQQVQGSDHSRSSDDRWTMWLDPTIKALCIISAMVEERVGLVFSPARAIFAGVGILFSIARDVRGSQDTLLDVFEHIGSFFRRLEVFTVVPPTTEMMDTNVQIIVNFLSILEVATRYITQGRMKKFAKKLIGYNDLEVVVMSLDILTDTLALMATAEVSRTTHAIDERDRVDSIIDQTDGNRLRWDVQQWLSPPDPSTNHDFVRKARHGGTAAWFFESNVLTEWKTRGSLLWIHGKPGAGKSTLLSAIVQNIEGMHSSGLAMIAYYYFDFQDARKQDCYGLLSSLISQLSAKSDSCFNAISQLYSDHAHGIRKPDYDALKKCMTDMLSLPGQHAIYIIVDALDECPNLSGTPSAREEVLGLIEELIDLKLPNLRLCVSSRPELDIRMVLELLTSLKVSLHDESGQKEDIIAYIKSVVHLDRSMRRWKEEDRQLVLDTLSVKADGMFRWVVCQVDLLRRTFPANIRSVLNELPETLDETFVRTLLGIDEAMREHAQQLFRCLAMAIRPLLVEELAEIFAIRLNKTGPRTFNPAWRPRNPEEALISACSSLIAIVDRDGSRIVEFSHFTVKQFLTSGRLAASEERLSYYHILPEPAHTLLAHACLSVLLQLDDKIDKDAIAHFPLAPYAARYWVDHAQFGNVSVHLRDVMERLFDTAKPHFAAWVWLYDIDRQSMEPMSTINPTLPEAMPLYYATLCGFRGLVERLIAAYPQDVDSRAGSHTTPLHAATVKGHLEVTSLLLGNGVDPNTRDNRGRAPLHNVSQDSQLVKADEIARLLVDSGADVDIIDDEDQTPLHLASRQDGLGVSQLLIEHGADVTAKNKDCETSLHLASRQGGFVAQLLILHGADVMAQNKDGETPLHLASRQGGVGVAQLLIEHGADVTAQNKERETPLHLASRQNIVGVARLLVEHGADVTAQNKDKESPLHLASRQDSADVAQLLILYGAAVTAKNKDWETSLHLASRQGGFIAQLLIEHGADVTAQNKDMETPLHLASRQGGVGVAQLLIERGVDVMAQNKDRETPLHLASRQDNIDVAQLLIEHGADITAKNKDWETSLHLASRQGGFVARLLIEHGADVTAKNKDWESPLHVASRQDGVRVARLLIEQGADVTAQNKDWETPLHLASREDKVGVARMLIEHRADVMAQNKDEETPLHLASRRGQVKAARMLIEHGADVTAQNKDRVTPLHLASRGGQGEIALMLIELGAHVTSQDKDGWNPLHLALSEGHEELVRIYIEHPASEIAQGTKKWTPLRRPPFKEYIDVAQALANHGADAIAQGGRGLTPLHLASGGHAKLALILLEHCADAAVQIWLGWTSSHPVSSGEHVELTRVLLERGADADARDNDNCTPLHWASERGLVEVVRILLEHGVDAGARDNENCTPLHWASEQGHSGVVRVLVEHGVDVNARDYSNWTALHGASQHGHLRVVRFLLEHGANANASDQGGWTSLQWPSNYNGDPEIVRVLLKHGADADTRDNSNWTPLHGASQQGHVDVARVLLEYGADANSHDDSNQTPLHLASREGHLGLVELLAENWANVHVRNNEGRTPLKEALVKGHNDVIQYLLKYGAS